MAVGDGNISVYDEGADAFHHQSAGVRAQLRFRHGKRTHHDKEVSMDEKNRVLQARIPDPVAIVLCRSTGCHREIDCRCGSDYHTGGAASNAPRVG